VGKTRLAVEVARDAASSFPHGCAFADLVPVREGFVVQSVASVLGVSERPQQPLADAVLEHLAGRRALLVLDNCEHLLGEAAAFTERLLAACPGVRVLVTSRERLAVTGEHVVAVPPLSLVTGGPEGVAGSEAARLFTDRACAVDSGFVPAAAVDELCARLEGMPLAIELAAARTASLGLDGLLAGLDDYLRLLAGGRGANPRHHSLRAVISWSHDLLDDTERARCGNGTCAGRRSWGRPWSSRHGRPEGPCLMAGAPASMRSPMTCEPRSAQAPGPDRTACVTSWPSASRS
jgi:predicted ATPase